ncbi:ATP-binding cassette domain-containing protein [Virgibacillus dakarensis]|uniref:ABC transporter n=1 Tax=Lentibacillus populi TaxID=1827502 RepID=A0A9W5U1Q2_9BACI|nr:MULTISPECIES: ABC transporter ATP-binding protein [Bacillaceae]MBT2214639.1 ABC transporter ATP-binding protein [Virgibacillus dakarensis]MTW87932.1 ATP-binding cassette domain-containing protein [Virgibacillus dakarensis]GGB58462.1 ABC transporter [Lentibacillus populi]
MNIKVKNLSLTYRNHVALKDITLELSGEKIYGLLGRNGAGKTSLLSVLASFREASSGSITINGEEPFENAKIMQQVAFMYDKDYKDESDNVKDMLQDIQRYRPNFDMDYAEYLIEKFKLNKKKPVKQFSKGMQSALNVIIGLSTRAPVTIFDEVYLGMDAPSRDIFYKELLKDQQNHPRIMILSTHLVSEMDYLFDEVIIINKGKFLLQEEYNSLISKGATITGNRELVDNFVQAKEQINVQQLGDTKSVMIYGELDDHERNTALAKGLEVAPVSLHDLFVHLTEEE